MSDKTLDALDIIDRLARARLPGGGPFALAFDADGTLWSGDVGEDTFTHATSHGRLQNAGLDAMRAIAHSHGLDESGSPSELGAALFSAYLRGALDERLTCEVLTWCYAGSSSADLAALAEEAFVARGLRQRARAILRPIFDWARSERAFVFVISASPRIVIEAALAHCGIVTDAVIAGVAAESAGRITSRMAGPIPYGPEKRVQGEALLRARGDVQWLGSFGDNVFDLDMLRAAAVGVAVCPKPALVERLPELSHTVVLC